MNIPPSSSPSVFDVRAASDPESAMLIRSNMRLMASSNQGELSGLDAVAAGLLTYDCFIRFDVKSYPQSHRRADGGFSRRHRGHFMRGEIAPVVRPTHRSAAKLHSSGASSAASVCYAVAHSVTSLEVRLKEPQKFLIGDVAQQPRRPSLRRKEDGPEELSILH
jgi:hypothetical protein